MVSNCEILLRRSPKGDLKQMTQSSGLYCVENTLETSISVLAVSPGPRLASGAKALGALFQLRAKVSFLSNPLWNNS